MRFSVFVSAMAEGGGVPSLAAIGEFIEDMPDEHDFGVSEVEVNVCFDRGKPRAEGWEGVFDRHQEFLQSLPKSRFERKKRRLTVSYKSNLTPVNEILDGRKFDAILFRQGFDEMIGELSALATKLDLKAGLKFSALLEGIRATANRLPSDESALLAALQSIRERAKAKWDQLPWQERVGIDWDDFHADAQALLDDPFFWDEVDGHAPHGNDTGADLLAEFRTWRARNKSTPILEFLDDLLRSWGFDEGTQPDGVVLPQATVELTRDEATIALAFAQIKIEGRCEAPLRERALIALARQSSDSVTARWRSDALRKMQTKLLDKRLKK